MPRAVQLIAIGVPLGEVAEHVLAFTRWHTQRDDPAGDARRRRKAGSAALAHGRSSAAESPRLNARTAASDPRSAARPDARTE